MLYAEIVAKCNDLPDNGDANYLAPKPSKERDESLWNAKTYHVSSGTVLLDSTFNKEENLNLSYWIKIDPTEELIPNRALLINGKSKLSSKIWESPNLLDGWLFISQYIQTETGKRHQFQIRGNEGTISRVMLRAANSTIIHTETSGTRFLNNVPIP